MAHSRISRRVALVVAAPIAFAACSVLPDGAAQPSEFCTPEMAPMVDALKQSAPPRLVAIADSHGNTESLEVLKCLITELEPPSLIAYELPDIEGCEDGLCPEIWTGGSFDGRNSLAAWRFLTQFSKLTNHELILFDPVLIQDEAADERSIVSKRETLSKNRILDTFTVNGHRNLVLFTGSIRASRDPYTIIFDEPVETLFMQLERATAGTMETAISVAVSHKEESVIWQCREECGLQKSWPTDEYYRSQAGAGKYDVVVSFDRITMSPPAVLMDAHSDQ